MRIVQERGRAETVELGIVDGALVVDPVVKHCRADRLSGNDGEEGEIVHVKPWVWTGVDLLGESGEF